jgi:hypothetical protein
MQAGMGLFRSIPAGDGWPFREKGGGGHLRGFIASPANRSLDTIRGKPIDFLSSANINLQDPRLKMGVTFNNTPYLACPDWRTRRLQSLASTRSMKAPALPR